MGLGVLADGKWISERNQEDEHKPNSFAFQQHSAIKLQQIIQVAFQLNQIAIIFIFIGLVLGRTERQLCGS